MSDVEFGSSADAGAAIGVSANPTVLLGARARAFYRVECFDALGAEKWIEEFENLVVTAGKNKLLDATIKTGLASPLWYVGLKGTGSAVAGDTMSSHAGWSELGAATPTYSNATRPAFTPGAISAGSVDNSASKAVFTINATVTIFGAFLTDSSTVDGTTGTLYGAGDFASSRAVLSGDTVNVTLTLTT